MTARTRTLRRFAILLSATACVSACTAGSESTNTNAAPPAAHAQTGSASGAQSQQEPETQGDAVAGWTDDMEKAAEARGPELPGDSFLAQRLMPSGVPNAAAFAQAAQQAAQVRALTAKVSPQVAGRAWRFLGPRNVGGRVVDAAVDPRHPGGLYVATATNGVWHSTDAGHRFTSVWPQTAPHSMGALAISPDGTLYAGTGETNPGGGSITYGGSGVYRSTDGGKTWRRMGLPDSSTIGRIVVDPTNPNRVWVAVSGNLFVPGGQRGVYESTNAGNTWHRSLTPPTATTGAADLAVDPADHNHVIATMWDHIRKPGTRIYTGIGSGIWETRNAGRSWQRLGTDQGLRAPAKNVGRIGIAFAPSDSRRVYAIYANNGLGSFQDFFTSTDNGASWHRPVGASDLKGTQSVYGWWFARIFVDPKNADRLDVAGLNMSESTDGAKSFAPVCCLHSDQHIMVWDPNQLTRAYVGNDGGLYVSTKDGADKTYTQSNDQPWSQYQDVDVSHQDPSRFIGGLQDNGTPASWTNPPFQAIYGGDGQRALINPNDDRIYYACAQYGFCSGFDHGKSFRLPVKSKRFPYFMQMEFQPGDPSVMYAGGNRLNRSTDGGRTFTPITGDLGHGQSGHDRNPLYRNHYGTISAIAIAPKDPKTIWVGTDNGYLYRSTDHGRTFTQLPPPVRPRLWISRIVIDPNDTNVVYVAFSGYREGNDAPYVLRSRDGGGSWTDISANLPHAPVNDLAVVKGTLYAATDVGVFLSRRRAPHWIALGSDLPQLVITDLRYEQANATLYIATFGMGVWSTKI